MIPYDFTKNAEKQFFKLPHDIQKRIIKKIESYLNNPDPLAFAKRLIGSSHPPAYRFQAGDYRVIFDWEAASILITRVGHHRDVYRAIP